MRSGLASDKFVKGERESFEFRVPSSESPHPDPSLRFRMTAELSVSSFGVPVEQ